MFQRSSGVLLHITSLPGPFGCGTFGREARDFVDLLASTRCAWWQVLPFAPPHLGNSPYSAYSAFAGNPLFIDPAQMQAEGLIDVKTMLAARWNGSPYAVEFDALIPQRMELLRHAYACRSAAVEAAVEAYAREQAHWLPDYALFMALCQQYEGMEWPEWPDEGLRGHDPQRIQEVREELTPEIGFWCFVQWLFYRQWDSLKAYAAEKGVGIIGDMPIYMSLHSADVWAHPELYELKDGEPLRVAGAPPDAFSADGQRWGNPLYDWQAMKQDGYRWWLERIGWALAQFDAVRIDHFRGFSAYWAIPANAATAKEGSWVPGPGAALFDAVAARYPDAPIIAEDLGQLDEDVHALRDRTGYPGMRVMQFAFEPGNDPHLPHNYPENVVAYTGTHDNNTTLGYMWEISGPVRDFATRYIGFDGDWKQGGAHSPVCRAMMRCLWQSAARVAVVPFQDLMGWGEDTRMNRPGVSQGCWSVRISPQALWETDRDWLRQLNYDFGRVNKGFVREEGRE